MKNLTPIILAAIALTANAQTQRATQSWQFPTGGNLRDAYRTPSIPPVQLSDSPRLDTLLKEGKLVLSIQDAIALALENNLDLELVRYAPRLAETDILRAESGSTLRGVPLSARRLQWMVRRQPP